LLVKDYQMTPLNENLSSIDERLVEIIAASAIENISDVIGVMQRINDALPNEDGLKWFNFLYLKVTESVSNNPPALAWENPEFLNRLAIVFANLYLGAVANWQQNRETVARAWTPLFESRGSQNVMRVQFAIAGMNAHINRDLAIALVQTAEELNVVPRRDSQEHRDFMRVNDILERVAEDVKQTLATGIVGEIDQDLGRLDDVVAFWSVRKARETAWTNAEILWQIKDIPVLADAFLINTDRFVGLTSRGLLIPLA
jgi:hypothetical protein